MIRTRGAVRADVDLLADVGAVEVDDVVAALALDGVAAVTGVPLEVVVAGAQLRRVGADVAVDEVVPAPAEQHVGAVAAAQRVVAVAAVERQLRQRADAVLRVDRVVAAEALHGEALDRARVQDPAAGDERADRGGAVARDADRVGGRAAAVRRGVGPGAAVDADRARVVKPTPLAIVSAPPSMATLTVSTPVSAPATSTCDAEAGDRQLAGLGARVDVVVAVGPGRGHAVGQRVAGAVERGEVDVRRSSTAVPARSPTVTLSAPPSVRTFTRSIPSKSIVTAATLRKSRAREPFAVTSICSPMFEPLKSSASVPPSPSTVSLPSPGSHWKWSSPAPRLRGVGADVAVDEVVAAAADQQVGAVAAAQGVVAVRRRRA